eukprot:TRINITY_DN1439_c0_g5_i1.p1 TRINITY_DN1439_c0_g5~~TRINITY_DN1439_c0_g5_i1.p1  ORF type:complete len:571 (+),score=105.02 TRINITY_DN1439_c0_g5_i1:76-1713(+)
MKAILSLLALFSVTHAIRRNTTSGEIDGVLVTDPNIGSQQFLGIPYAAPPVGDLRWANPVDHPKWDTPLNASNLTVGCPQVCGLPAIACPEFQSESCLYLNVFAPLNATVNSNLPVLIWFHGGNFFQGFGGGPLYDGSHHVNRSNVIIVGVNYRLGALGFLATADYSGNFGFFDQQQAMRWVAANIANFGGNPNMVTLWGQSAGAMSIALHMTTPSSSNLFHRVIMQSEPFTIPFRTPDSSTLLSNAFGRKLGCSPTNNTCMRSKPWEEVLAAQIKTQSDLGPDIESFLHAFVPWTPNVRGAIAPTLKDPTNAWYTADIDDKPIIITNAGNEARIFIWEAAVKDGKMIPLTKPMYWGLVGSIFQDKALVVNGEYPSNSTDNRELATKIGTEYIFNCANRKILKTIAASNRKSPLYYGLIDQPMSFGAKVWNNDPECVTYTCHGGDLAFSWAQMYNPDLKSQNITYEQAEIVLSDQYVDMFGSFAWGRAPVTRDGLAWPEFKNETILRLSASWDGLTKVMQNATEGRYQCDFWDNKVDMYNTNGSP